MRLLLDEMWSPEIAIQLRRRGYDVIAIGELPDLRGKLDPVIFAWAQAEGRAIVTDNTGDYRSEAAKEFQQGRSHSGLIFTNDRHSPRGNRRIVGSMVNALEALLSRGPDLTGQEYWLT